LAQLRLGKKEETKNTLLSELIKGVRRSDRDLAKSVKTSQPTVSRRRAALEREGLVQEYTVIPDLQKMGYEILAITFMSFGQPPRPDVLKRARAWTGKQPSVIFAADGEGLGMNSVMVSAHKDYAGLSEMLTELRRDWHESLKSVESFRICVDRPEHLIKRFSFRHLLTKE
jgi:DNA-binding Lrp family transcriptional regulator